jgi:hypothetical protein
LFDKSLELGGATSKSKPSFKWLEILHDDIGGRVVAYWIDEMGAICHRVGRVG